MVAETILQHEVLTKFAYPFLLIFFIVFAILEKTKLLGEDKKQLNALISFVIGLIFVSAVQPKLIVGDLILFLTVALVIVFVVLLIWGFIFGDIKEGFKLDGWMKWSLGILSGIAVIIAVIWATGVDSSIVDYLFKQSWSSDFWTNASFVLVVAAALALILRSGSSK
jgi:hypothetical protein